MCIVCRVVISVRVDLISDACDHFLSATWSTGDVVQSRSTFDSTRISFHLCKSLFAKYIAQACCVIVIPKMPFLYIHFYSVGNLITCIFAMVYLMELNIFSSLLFVVYCVVVISLELQVTVCGRRAIGRYHNQPPYCCGFVGVISQQVAKRIDAGETKFALKWVKSIMKVTIIIISLSITHSFTTLGH